MNKLIFTLLCLIALAAGLALQYLKVRSDRIKASATSTEITATRDNLSLQDHKGQQQSADQWAGKVVVANHWATWCPPCKEEIPMLIQFNEDMQDKGVQVIGIAHDRAEPVQLFMDQSGLNYPSLIAFDNGRELLSAHGNTHSGALPYTVIFDRNGKLVETKLGLVTYQELEQLVAPYL